MSDEPLRVTILGEDRHDMAERLADRMRDAGITVTAGDIGAAHRPSDEVLSGELAASDAAIDFCIVDRGRKGYALRLADEHLPPGRPLLSCCHATTATFVAASVTHRDRVVGFGLLPPDDGRETVECARALQSSEEVVAATDALWSAVGLEAVWVGDATGLVMPRIVACLANEAAFAVMEGAASAVDVDRAMKLGTRYPHGPLEWANQIGLESVVATLDALSAEQGEDRYRVAPLLRKMAVAGRRWDVR